MDKNNRKTEYLAYQTLLLGGFDKLYGEFSIEEILEEINNPKYLVDILLEHGKKPNLKRNSLLYIIEQTLKTEIGADLLLDTRLDIFNKKELKYIVDIILDRYRNKLYKLCGKFVIKHYYKNLQLTMEQTELIESMVTAHKLSD